MIDSNYDPTFYETIHREINRLAALESNWDAQGAKPMEAEIIDAAHRFADHLPADLICPPKVVPMAKGNLQFEWHAGPQTLELEFEDPQTIHYLKWHPQAGIEEEGVFSTDEMRESVSLLRWFNSAVY